MKQIEQELFPALGIQSKLLQAASKLGKKRQERWRYKRLLICYTIPPMCAVTNAEPSPIGKAWVAK